MSRNVRELSCSASPLRSGAIVATEKVAHALATANRTAGSLRLGSIDQLVAQPVVVPLAMVMRHEVGERPPKMAFTELDDAIEAFRCVTVRT
jgi:hypothetical protein